MVTGSVRSSCYDLVDAKVWDGFESDAIMVRYSETGGPGVVEVAINRDSKRNALTESFFVDLKKIFTILNDSREVKVVILNAAGRGFCAGLDSEYLARIPHMQFKNKERLGLPYAIYSEVVRPLQDAVASISECTKLTIAVIHGICIGAGVEITAACDIRIGTGNSRYSLKENPLGLVPDLGAIQRLPLIINPGLAKELIFTGRWMDAEESLNSGFITHLKPLYCDAMAKAYELATVTASHTFSVVVYTKKCCIYSENHSVEESLDHCAVLASQAIAHSIETNVGKSSL